MVWSYHIGCQRKWCPCHHEARLKNAKLESFKIRRSLCEKTRGHRVDVRSFVPELVSYLLT